MTHTLNTQLYTTNPSHQALWSKVKEGFKLISGKGWEERADYKHFWTLCDQLYKLANGEKAEMSDNMKGSLGFMFAGHASRKRKGLRERPYFHHILMVWFLAMLAKMPEEHIIAAIHHDDGEDIPKNLGVSLAWVNAKLTLLAGYDACKIVLNLSNDETAPDKHAGQVAKMSKIPMLDAALKLLDRTANMYDMRQDAPKGFTPERIAQECQKARDLAQAMPEQAPSSVLAMLSFGIELLEAENGLAA